jgi:hypothetical protein
MDLVGYLYEDYHDARSLEHKLFMCFVSYLAANALFAVKTRC